MFTVIVYSVPLSEKIGLQITSVSRKKNQWSWLKAKTVVAAVTVYPKLDTACHHQYQSRCRCCDLAVMIGLRYIRLKLIVCHATSHIKNPANSCLVISKLHMVSNSDDDDGDSSSSKRTMPVQLYSNDNLLVRRFFFIPTA